MAGWTRQRRGKGFSYTDEAGRALAAEDVERVKSLAIPPAWTDVWICPVPNGHLQATGTDDAGRRQYLYHPDWRARQDELKFERILEASRRLPEVRRRVTRDLHRDGVPWERACATAVRMLDLGYFRIGHDVYTDANGSFGLTTLERQHVRRRGQALVFSFIGKSGISHSITVDDAPAVAALEVMRKRTSDSARLLAYKVGRGWSDLGASDVNAYLGELFGGTLTAKDFRTWHATVHAAVSLAASPEPGDTKASQKRAVKEAVRDVSDYLGNTPTIAKNSYIDPRVLDLYDSGTVLQLTTRTRTPEQEQVYVERAVRRLLS